MDQKEAYHYQNYIPKLEGARLKVVHNTQYITGYQNHRNKAYGVAEAMAALFKEGVKNAQISADIEDFVTQKLELSDDRTGLILGEISGRESIKYENLERLYYDLLKVDNWRLERPFPDNYRKDQLWSELNRMELQITEQIRRELKDSARDAAFPQKDLRESLLEFKLQHNKSQLLQGGLEMELDSSHKTEQGDMYQHENPH